MTLEEEIDQARYFKEDEKGVAAMCKVMEDMRNEIAKKTKIDDIKNVMESFGVTIEKAMESLKIPVADRAIYAGIIQKNNCRKLSSM